MQLAKRLIEAVLFFFSGVLINLAFSGKLDYVYNLILFSGAIIIIAYIAVNEILGEKTKEKISLLKTLLKEKNF